MIYKWVGSLGYYFLVRFIMSLRAEMNNELITKKGNWYPGKKVLIYLLDRDGGLNNTAIAGLLDGLHSSGIGRIILKVSKEIASGKHAKIEVKGIAKFYLQQNEVVNSQLKV